MLEILALIAAGALLGKVLPMRPVSGEPYKPFTEAEFQEVWSRYEHA